MTPGHGHAAAERHEVLGKVVGRQVPALPALDLEQSAPAHDPPAVSQERRAGHLGRQRTGRIDQPMGWIRGQQQRRLSDPDDPAAAHGQTRDHARLFEAAEPLAEIARRQPAFRVFALTALSVMTDYIAYDQLCELLSVPSAETRYGAFRALWAMNAQDPLIKGEVIGDQFHYHVMDVAGGPMIHVTRNRLPEIVIFGPEQRLLTPLALSAGNEIMITSHGGGEISVSKYTVRDGDQKRIVSTRVDDVIRAVVELGGTYPDVVQALQEAKNCAALRSRFEVDALPKAGRIFDRDVDGMVETDQGEQGDGQQLSVKSSPESPSPELFHQRGGSKSKADQTADDVAKEKSGEEDDSNGKSNTKKGFFARMFGR